jgi:hypothetical protein
MINSTTTTIIIIIKKKKYYYLAMSGEAGRRRGIFITDNYMRTSIPCDHLVVD